MNFKTLWLAFAAVVVLSFAVLGWIGRPHLPGGAADPRAGRDHRRARELIGAGEIQRGPERLAVAGRHGGRLGLGPRQLRRPRLDRRLAAPRGDRSSSTAGRSAEFGSRYAALDAEQQAAAAAAASQQMMRTNTYDPATRHRSPIDPVRAEAFEANLAHYADVFANGQRRVRHPRRRADATPTACGSWPPSSSGPRGRPPRTGPATTITYTQQLAARAAGRQRPTGDAVVWTGVSIIMLLAGIAAMVWWYAAREHEAAAATLPDADPLLGCGRHAVAAGDRQVLLGRRPR